MSSGFQFKAEQDRLPARGVSAGLLVLAPLLAGLYFLSRANYLLFHAIVECFSIIVACGIFMIAWNSRRFQENGFFLCLGVASLCVAGVDFLHTLSYKNMGVFPDAGANLPTQLWIVGRYLEAAGLVLAPFFVARRPSAGPLLGGFLVLGTALVATVFRGLFPDCYRSPEGLTAFKVGSEYLVCLLLAGSLALVRRRRKAFDPDSLRLLGLAVCALIAAELSFTLYTDVFGFFNMAGHLFKVLGFYFIYRGVVEAGLSRPFDLLFRELKQSEARYRGLYENTPVMLHSIDLEGRLVSVSQYWLTHLGYRRQEVLGRKYCLYLDEESRRRAEETVLPGFFRTGSCRDVPYRVLKKNGEAIDVLLSAIAERDERGDIVRSLAVMVDVTERKRNQEEIELLNDELLSRAEALEEVNTELEAANEQLAQSNIELESSNDRLETANRDLEAFNYSVSHDLRGPITAISGQCQIVLQIFADKVDAEVKDFIQGIHDQTLRMNNLITTLLEFARLGKVPLRRQRVDLGSMARSIAMELALRDPQRIVQFDIADGMEAEADPALLQILLENLLGNAWKYSLNMTEASIRVGRLEEKGRAVFFIRDNGVGFDPAQADELFNPFKRLNPPAGVEGFGIGLATVKRIVERHGGEIRAQGEPGKGATFFIAL